MNFNQIQSEEIKIIFRTFRKEDTPIGIKAFLEEKVSTLIERWRMTANNHESTLKFIYLAKNLNPDLTLAEARITNNAIIFVVNTEYTYGEDVYCFRKK